MSKATEQDMLECMNCAAPIDDDQQDTGLCAECLPLLSLPDLPPDTPTVEPAKQEIQLQAPEGMSKDAALAMNLLRPTLLGAATIEAWQGRRINNAKLDIQSLANELSQQVSTVIESGDMGRCEALLITQAHVLDTVANNLLSRAANADYLEQIDTYTKLGLRAQSQCRTTVEAPARRA